MILSRTDVTFQKLCVVWRLLGCNEPHVRSISCHATSLPWQGPGARFTKYLTTILRLSWIMRNYEQGLCNGRAFVRLSVSACRGFAAERRVGGTYQSTASAPGTGPQHGATSKCGQCHVDNWHRKLNTNMMTCKIFDIQQSCPWVHFVWPNPTQPNPIQLIMELTVW